jgi:signal peptidase II
MNPNRFFRILFILILLGTAISCDQISKSMVRQKINYDEQIDVIRNHMTLTRVENRGAFLSLGDTLPGPIKILLLTVLPLSILGAVLIYLLAKQNLSKISVIGLCCITGGGIGNIYDRLMYGSVTDFMHIDFVLFQTGIFNLADVSIMLGVSIVLTEYYIKGAKEIPSPENPQTESDGSVTSEN